MTTTPRLATSTRATATFHPPARIRPPADVHPDVQIHPAALCESSQVGPGTRIWAFAHVLDGATIGVDCNICDHVFVESGVTIGDRVTVKNGVMLFTGVTVGDDAFLGPGVVFTNDLHPRAHLHRRPDELLATAVGAGATLGAGVVVVCGTSIGEDAFVGAGSVVTRDVEPGAFVVGNPARRIGWACRCGRRLLPDGSCPCDAPDRPPMTQ